MPPNWIDVTELDFNALLLLEREQLGWLPTWRWQSPGALSIALQANPCVAWSFRHKNPSIAPWVDGLLASAQEAGDAEDVRENVFAVDGLITAIPFPNGFAGVVMGGHVFGDAPAAELAEMERVTRPGGMVVFMPAANSTQDSSHRFLVEHGYAWEPFLEPGEGEKLKYWKQIGP